MAAALRWRLARLQAMREAAVRVMARDRLGRDVFARGAPEPIVVDTKREYADNLIDLLKAYADRRKRKMVHQTYVPKRHPTWSIKEARNALERMVGVMERIAPWLALECEGAVPDRPKSFGVATRPTPRRSRS